MNPETSGPRTGPINGAAEKIIIGLMRLVSCEVEASIRDATHVPTFALGKTSEIAPPETERKAEPEKPVRKRKMRWTAMLLAGPVISSASHYVPRCAHKTPQES